MGRENIHSCRGDREGRARRGVWEGYVRDGLRVARFWGVTGA